MILSPNTKRSLPKQTASAPVFDISQRQQPEINVAGLGYKHTWRRVKPFSAKIFVLLLRTEFGCTPTKLPRWVQHGPRPHALDGLRAGKCNGTPPSLLVRKRTNRKGSAACTSCLRQTAPALQPALCRATAFRWLQLVLLTPRIAVRCLRNIARRHFSGPGGPGGDRIQPAVAG